MSEERRQRLLKYKREWMKNHRKKLRKKELIKKGHCPICEMLLDEKFEYYHRNCKWFKENYPNKVPPFPVYTRKNGGFVN